MDEKIRSISCAIIAFVRSRLTGAGSAQRRRWKEYYRPMALQKLRTDFNSNSLGNAWTQADLQRQGISLQEGMRFIFYDLDCEDNREGFLHTAGTVWWDTQSDVFRIDLRTTNYRFTPGTVPDVLDSEYNDGESVAK